MSRSRASSVDVGLTILMVCGAWLVLAAGGAGVGAQDAAQWPITYEIDEPGGVSLAVYDADGRLRRTLLAGANHEPGAHKIAWDGLDATGRPLTPGEYTWRLLRTGGFQAEYLLTVGTNPGSAPYDVWVGNHRGPGAVHVDGQNRMYIGAAMAEGVNALIAQSVDGRQRLWEASAYPSRAEYGVVALAGAGDHLYVLSGPRYVQVRDATSGEVVKVFDALWPGDQRPGHGGRPGVDLIGGDGWFAVSDHDHDAIRFFDLDSAHRVGQRSWRTIYGGVTRTIAVPAPRAICRSATAIYALSRGAVVKLPLDEPDGVKTIIPASVLDHPRDLAFAPQRGELLITHGRPRANQVSRFSSTGERLATYGREDGRAFGPWEPRDFHRITALAADGRGGFVVTEEGDRTVRRTAHFDRDGHLVNEWFGGQRWGSFVTWDPDDATHVALIVGRGVRGFAKVDYERARWRLLSVYPEPDTQGLFPPLTEPVQALWELRRRHGELYLVTVHASPAHAVAIYRVDQQQHRFVPVACAGVVPPRRHANEFWQPLWDDQGESSAVDLSEHNVFTWSDRNGNGRIELDELRFAALPRDGMFHRQQAHLDNDWHFDFVPSHSPPDADRPAWYRVPNRAAEDPGAPDWDWADRQASEARLPQELIERGRPISVMGHYHDQTGSVYQLYAAERLPDDDRQGDVWPAVRRGLDRLVRWDAQRDVRWSVGRHGTDNQMPPGQFQTPKMILGEAHGNVIVHDRVVRPATAWTPEGLYAGYLLEGRIDDGLPDYVYHTWAPTPTTSPKSPEQGLLLHDHVRGALHVTESGEVLWNPAGRGGAVIYRIHGWDGWTRAQGTVEIDRTPPHAKGEGTGLRGAYFFDDDATDRPPDLTRTDAQIWFGPRRMPATADPRRPRVWFEDEQAHAADALAAVRWTGRIEPRFTEPHRFTTESDPGSRVRLWIDDRLVLDQWSSTARDRARWRRLSSERIDMQAGRTYRIRLEYAPGGQGEPAMHLNWESFPTQERQHVPAQALYAPGEGR